MAGWIKRIFGNRTVFQKANSSEKTVPVRSAIEADLPEGITKDNWRDHVCRMASPIEVGGFKPTGNPLASVFGDVRVSLENEQWPTFEGLELWPLCQFNLLDAPLVPNELTDVKFITIFVHPNIIPIAHDIIDTTDVEKQKPMVIRVYDDLSELVEIRRPQFTTHLKPFEVRWQEPVPDYPTHDCMAFDFDLLGLGDFYDQSDVENLQATKFGGHPGTIQSEPWWDYKKNEEKFSFVMQIESEPKAYWGWGDGAAFLARSEKAPHLWALDIQFT